MQYTPRGASSNRSSMSADSEEFLYESLEPVISGLRMSLIELSVFRQKGKGNKAAGIQVRAVVMSKGVTSLEDCSRVHRGIMPRLSLAFPGEEISLEVSSPGIDRLIKDASEFVHYTGRGIKCYRIDISDWTEGVLLSADGEKLVLKKEEEEIVLGYEIIAKAKLNAHPAGTALLP